MWACTSRRGRGLENTRNSAILHTFIRFRAVNGSSVYLRRGEAGLREG